MYLPELELIVLLTLKSGTIYLFNMVNKHQSKRFAHILSVLVIFTGMVVLIGWTGGFNSLKSLSPIWVSMKANTAISFILCGLSIILLQRKNELWGQRAAVILSGIVLLLSVLTIMQYFLQSNFHIDELLFKDNSTLVGKASPGRQSPVSSICFFVFSISAISAYRKVKPFLFFQYGNLLIIIVAFVSLTGYILQNQQLYGFRGYSNMPFHTAFAFILLACAALCLYPGSGFMKLFTSRRYTSIILRKTLPGFVCMVLLLGWLNLQGEQAGLYDFELGFTLFILLLIIFFSIQLTGIALALAKKEDQQKDSEQLILKANANLEMAEKQAKLGNWEYNSGSNESFWSKQMYRIFERDPAADVPDYDSYMQYVHPEDLKGVKQFYADMLLGINQQQQIQFRTNPAVIPLKYLTTSWYVQKKNEDGSMQLFGTLQDITDSILTQKKLSESEARAKMAYEHSSVIIWEEDFSFTKAYLNNFMQEHGPVLETFLLDNPEILKEAAALVKITAVNKTALDYYRAKSLDELLTFLPDWFVEESWPVFANELHMLMNGQTHYENEITIVTPEGEKRSLLFNFTVPPQYVDTLEKVLLTFIDITPLKEAQNELAKNEAKYRSLIEQASDGIAITDNEGRFLEVNESYCKLTGYTSSAFKQMNLVDILPPEDVNLQPPRIAELAAGQNLIYERRIRRKDGTMFDAEINSKMAADGTFIGFMRDISERKMAAHIILNERDLSKSLINSLPGVFYFFNSDGQFLKWNNNFEKVTGYSGDEISRMHPVDFFPEEEKALLTEKINNVFEDGEDNVEAHFLTKSGERLPYFFTGCSLVQNEETFLLGVGIDISKRKAAEAALVISEERFRSLVEQASDAILITDEHMNYIHVNTAATRMLGYTRQELLNLNASDITTLNSKEILLLIQELKEGKKVMQERIFKRKDGSSVPVEISASIMKNGNFMAIVRDISERKRIQEQVKKYNEELKLLTAHLLLVREEERKRIGREVHDELGQQMTAIKMDIAWIDKKISAEETQIKLKLKNVNELLDGSNASVRRIISELRPSALDEFGLMNALEWHGKQFTSSSGVPVNIQSSQELIRVPEKIATCIYRVYQESLTNVARYANATHVNIIMELRQESIVVTIEDDGDGFEPESISRKSFGILGMKERVQSLNGVFNLFSVKNKGTVVQVVLPLEN